MKEEVKFDFKQFEVEALKGLREGKSLEGKEGVLATFIKRLVEAGLNREMDAHLADPTSAEVSSVIEYNKGIFSAIMPPFAGCLTDSPCVNQITAIFKP